MKSSTSKHWLAALPVALLLGACESGVDPIRPLEQLPRSLSAAEREVISSSNEFAFDLLRSVNAGEEGENVFVSPLSVSMALGMTMNGAHGETFDEMRATLGFEGLTQEQINTAYSDLLDLLLGLDRSVQIQVGNSVWYRQEFPFEANFFATVRRGFRAHVEGLDFTDDTSIRQINDWVDDATRGRIGSIIDEIPDEAVMYLINAIYFKGGWVDPFDRARTRSDRFVGLDGAELDVRMMSNDGTYAYAWDADYEAIDLPYGNGAFAMTIVLPKGAEGVNGLLDGLDAGKWDAMLASLARGRLIVEVPRFRLEYEKGLKDALGALGMVTPFAEGRADFSGMSAQYGRDLVITEVKHKTFVEVNEEGTEAAAATSVGVGVTSMPPLFRADRPFLFAIRERFSGTILFMGKIVAPPPAEG